MKSIRIGMGILLVFSSVAVFANNTEGQCVRSTSGGYLGCNLACVAIPGGSACRGDSVYGPQGYCWSVQYVPVPGEPAPPMCHDGEWDPCCSNPDGL